MRRPKALKRKLFRYIDVFAGCGGLALGFHQAKWQGIFAIEKDSRAFETLQYNLIKRKRHFRWPKWLPKRRYCINTLLKSYPEKLKELRGRIEVVAGGPPCQGFSLAAGRRNKDAVYSHWHFEGKFELLLRAGPQTSGCISKEKESSCEGLRQAGNFGLGASTWGISFSRYKTLLCWPLR